MRILADENVPLIAVKALQTKGHDVLWILAESPGVSDEQVLHQAEQTNRILITFDKDFGELALRKQPSRPPGVILFRTRLVSPARLAEKVAAIIKSRDDWADHFSVVDDKRIRMVTLPR